MDGTKTNGAKPERRDITSGVYGVRRELPGGGWIRVLPRTGNVAMLRKRDTLQNAKRAELGLSPDKPLPITDTLELTRRMLLGTVITGWGGFIVDGQALPAPASTQRPDQPLDSAIEAAGLDLLGAPEMQKEITRELDAVDALYRSSVEVAEGNSETGSASS